MITSCKINWAMVGPNIYDTLSSKYYTKLIDIDFALLHDISLCTNLVSHNDTQLAFKVHPQIYLTYYYFFHHSHLFVSND